MKDFSTVKMMHELMRSIDISDVNMKYLIDRNLNKKDKKISIDHACRQPNKGTFRLYIK